MENRQLNKEFNKELSEQATVVAAETHSNACGKECNASVISSDTLTGAENSPWFGGQFKVPRVLSEFIVQLDSESKIKLNEPAYEIKRIEKQVFLTQCRYIPPTDKVFIEGYIRKNIEYATKVCKDKNNTGIGGTIKDTTVHIPFKAYTRVSFNAMPHVLPNLPPMVARYFDAMRMGKNIREADRSNIEIFNEPVYCELEWSAVFDADIDNKGVPIDGFINEEEFQEFTDKSVIYICMKLLQNQQVNNLDPKGMPHGMDDFKEAETGISQWNFPITDFMKK